LRRNARALKTLRTALLIRTRSRPAILFLALLRLLSFPLLAQALGVEGQVQASRGDHAAAMSCYLDALRLAEDVPRGGSVLSRLTGLVCGITGRERVWRQVDRLNGTEARAAARRLEAINARRVPFVDTLQEKSG
jgi:hypothetical protein